MRQKTISNPIKCHGIGVHSGDLVNVVFEPAPVDTGIVFNKVDKSGNHLSTIKADYSLVTDTRLCTKLSSEDGQYHISTVEHVMAALWGLSIDNIVITVDADEMPIMDGSSERFVFLLECAGIKKLEKNKKIIEVLKQVDITQGDSYVSISPSDNFSISMEIDFNNELIKKQSRFINFNDSCFKRDISRARTFGFLEEVEFLKKNGLAKGGSLDNAVVVDKDKILNEDGLRFEDEFVRHKILDAIGDLYLAGANFKAHFKGVKSGHQINNMLLRKLFQDNDAWRLIDVPNTNYTFASNQTNN